MQPILSIVLYETLPLLKTLCGYHILKQSLEARREIAKVVGHISLSFHRDDAPTLTDDRMRELAAAYMENMGIADTQYIVPGTTIRNIPTCILSTTG